VLLHVEPAEGGPLAAHQIGAAAFFALAIAVALLATWFRRHRKSALVESQNPPMRDMRVAAPARP
jgi:hypothetical protein